MPLEVYERIAAAAQTIGATLNQFLVQSALDKANDIFERERVITLSSRAAETFFGLIENPPDPIQIHHARTFSHPIIDRFSLC
ncbi:MAG: toxin-antitoxin system HicB family antitoxin [Syntrophobacterales bacterium CG03_land_8_20_14_0_80_58_14]|nr:MAG: toxin-antitoxin system HicB family antitoxin [Syntrophobacterales bacterium CG03_land_8_20_14_0_80_58_14]